MPVISLLIVLLGLSAASNPRTDQELTAGVASSDRSAFRALFERYNVPLHRFLVRLGVATEIAEDILQDVFVGLWNSRARLDPARSVRAYLYRACRNRAANHFRNRARRSDASVEMSPDHEPAPDDALAFVLLRDRVNEAIATLPERRRVVFELCFMSGLSYKEAAAALDISPKTVENQMGHALKTIREYLQPYLDRS